MQLQLQLQQVALHFLELATQEHLKCQHKLQHHQALHRPAPGTAAGGKIVFIHSYRSLLRLRKKFSAALMSMMNRNSTSAMENSACRCKPAAA